LQNVSFLKHELNFSKHRCRHLVSSRTRLGHLPHRVHALSREVKGEYRAIGIEHMHDHLAPR
jgi:transposase